MKKKMFLWMLCLPLVLTFTSCKEDDNNDEWRTTNEAAFSNVATSTEYRAMTTPQGPGTVYAKVIQSGTGTEKPLPTSRVKVLYYGHFYEGTVFDSGSGEKMDIPAYFPDKTSTNYTNNGVISGFSIALQNMVIGDKWEIWIPWDLGYGASSYGSIPGYSTLVFEVELLDFEMYPAESK
jgi:FKBP-type peptidyl-prolyl cis-trans isomerase